MIIKKIRAFSSEDDSEPVFQQKWRLGVVMLAISLGSVSPALPGDCRALIGQIDWILTRAKLMLQDAARIEELRDEGLRLHTAGRHPECITPLKQAAVLLGLEKT